jgi:NTP pyrophosphatase (non-canonical NTP hydrolase)
MTDQLEFDFWDYYDGRYDRMEEDFERDNYMFMEYQTQVEKLVLTTGEERLYENTLGLVGETGEVAEKVKKMVRDGNVLDKEGMTKELGDVLFYLTALASHLDIDMSEVAHTNINKLNDRKKRGVLQGSGDNR